MNITKPPFNWFLLALYKLRILRDEKTKQDKAKVEQGKASKAR